MQVLRRGRSVAAAAVILITAVLAGSASGLLATCGPFTDAAGDAFCPFILEIFYLGITTGTTPTAYDPGANVTRLQMAAFLSRTVDGALKRGSRRAALDQFWTTQNATVLGLTTVGGAPQMVQSDGADLWVSNSNNTVSRVRGSDGKLLETWTGATGAFGVLTAMGRVFVTNSSGAGAVFQIDPSLTSGAVTTVVSSLGFAANGITFDGSRIWTANNPGSVSIVTPGPTLPWTVTTVTTGFSQGVGALFDGSNVWVTDNNLGLLKLDANGAILQTVTLSGDPRHPVFDGSNIWVPHLNAAKVVVVRASSGAVLATLTGANVAPGFSAAFDGQRVLIANFFGAVTLFKAADLTQIGGFFPTGASTTPLGACSDGVNFWVALTASSQLARF
jgi:hypothetical protein